jgi:ComF family protein
MQKKRGFSEYVWQLLYPPRCIFCDNVVKIGEECPDCASVAAELKIQGEARFTLGFAPGRKADAIDKAVVSFYYTGAVAEAVARYKFREKKDVYRDMARYMAEDVQALVAAETIDMVVDVPSYKNGTDHARLIAKGVARQIDRPYCGNVLKKTRKTLKQHEQIYKMRYHNIMDAFDVAPGCDVKGKVVLICDDVMTSGNTLNMCAKALKAGGAATVIACAFSVTRPSEIGIEK